MDLNDLSGTAPASTLLGGIAGAMLGGLVSWLISYRAQKAARRFTQFTAFETVLDDLEQAAVAYWQKAGKDLEAESRIKSLMERVELRMQAVIRVVGHSSVKEECDRLFDAFDEEITGGSFEGAGRRKDSVKVYRLKQKAMGIRDALFKHV